MGTVKHHLREMVEMEGEEEAVVVGQVDGGLLEALETDSVINQNITSNLKGNCKIKNERSTYQS